MLFWFYVGKKFAPRIGGGGGGASGGGSLIRNWMIAQNEINVQGELANKTDNRTASYKHCTGRILVQIKEWHLCDYSIPDRWGEAHLTSLCN